MENYVSLHNHSEFSNVRFLDSCIKIKDLIMRAIELGFKGIAVTEHECLSGAVKILKIRDKIQEEHPDFKIIFGNEIYLIDEQEIRNTNKYYHFILLAKDEIGWQQLKELSSRAWDRGYTERGMMRVPTTYQDIEEVVGRNPGHIIGSTACFTAGHMVQTIKGLVKIEDIQSGDKVLTYDGSYQSVITPTTRKYNGGGRHIMFNNNGNQEITCTDNHQFLVFRYNYKATKKCSGGSVPELIWKTADSLRKGDKTLDLFPTYKYSYQTVFDINDILIGCGESPFSHLKYKLNRQIIITPELMRLYGLWLGDGSVSPETNRITISFSDKEFSIYKDFVLEGIKQLGNFKPRITYKSKQHKVEIEICSVELTKLVSYISNNGKSATKFIHPYLKHISQELDAEILYGYLLADGYYRGRLMDGKYLHEETVDATISQRLYDDITELYYSVGFIPSHYTIKEHQNHKTAFYHTSSKSFFGEKNNKKKILSHEQLMSFLTQRVKDHFKGRGCIYNGVKYLYKTVKDIFPIELNEDVYCLKVENNHNFICNGIIVHNCLGGRLPTLILNHEVEKVNSFVKWGINTFGKDDFFLELQVADTEEQVECNKILIKLSKHYNLRYIITTDTHYLLKEDSKIHSAFLNSRQSNDRETEKFYKYTYMMSVDEMREILGKTGMTSGEITTGFNNTIYIYDQIQNYDFRLSTIVPHAKIPEFKIKGIFNPYLERYPSIKKFIESPNIDDRYLTYLIEIGVLKKNIVLGETELARLNDELSVIDQVSIGLNQTVSSYFLLMKEVMDLAWNYSFIGCSRGSSAGFFINYLLELVQVNPLQYGLPYWRLTSF